MLKNNWDFLFETYINKDSLSQDILTTLLPLSKTLPKVTMEFVLKNLANIGIVVNKEDLLNIVKNFAFVKNATLYDIEFNQEKPILPDKKSIDKDKETVTKLAQAAIFK